MTEPFLPLTALSETQRAQALERFTIIRPALEDGVSRAQVARTSEKAESTIRLWIKRYREKGLAGLRRCHCAPRPQTASPTRLHYKGLARFATSGRERSC